MFHSHRCFCILCATLTALLALLLMLAAQPAHAADPTKPVSFINTVAPLLKEKCFGCHGAKNPKGKLDMTKYASFRKGGTKDDPVVPGKPDDSYLITVLTATDKKRMPPKDSGDPLPKDKIELIERWIGQGAKLDAGLKPEADLLRELRLRWTPPPPPAAYPYPVTITALAFTPDNKKVVVSGHHELTVWDAAGGKLEKRIYTRARRAMAMVFLPDGKLAVAGGRPGEEGDVRIYDINGGKPKNVNGVAVLDGLNDKGVMVKQLLDADDEVLCLALSADGKKLASGGCDRLVHIWDLSGGYAKVKELPSIENHADWVFGIAFTPDGKRLATASRDKTAKLWDIAAKESILTFPGHQNPVYGVAIKSDGSTGYSVGEDNQLRSWKAAAEGKQIRASGGHGKVILKLVSHPKKPLLATCSADQTVRIWDADKGSAVRTLSGHSDYVYAVAISSDGNLIVSGGFDGEVRVWKVADGALVKAFNASPGLQVATKAPAKK
ncbi:MAG TPA: c-type cytochrome domain-containing protein [Gemmataceae bacterium]|nr:c-type cytochrome domain-containing protein [Gemmataceae bacterium]